MNFPFRRFLRAVFSGISHSVTVAAVRRGSAATVLLSLAVAACTTGGVHPQKTAQPGPGAGGQEVTWVYACTDGSRFTAHFAGDQVRLFLTGRSLVLTQQPGSAETRYVRTMGPEQAVLGVNGSQASLHLPGQAERSCRGSGGPGPWELAQLAGVEFRAMGHQPEWVLEMGRQTGVSLTSEAVGGRQSFPWGQPEQKDQTAIWNLRAHNQMLTVLIAKRACVDSVSERSFDTTVTVMMDGHTLQGCGRLLTAPGSTR